MRLMIFSDVHGNLEALKAVLAHSEQHRVHRRICLGDLVGYGPYPEECIQLVRSLPGCRVIAGNHDVATLWKTSPYGMSSVASKVILWTMEQISEESKQYLAELPDRLDIAEMNFSHANPYNPQAWRYVFDRKHALRCFTATKSRYLFIGHSHRPLLITRNNALDMDIQPVPGTIRFKLSDTRRRIFNCGSVGQPRDRDPRSCYVIFDTRQHQVEYYRTPYDMTETLRAAQQVGLPAMIGTRLKKGL